MDIAHAKIIIDNLYSDIDGYGVSNIGRNTNGYRSKSFTYGEITPEAFQAIITDAEPGQGTVFYDMGSGTGKAVLLATMLFPFSKCIGIELVDSLYNTSVSILKRYRAELSEKDIAEPTFIHGNFLEVDITDADLIFAHSTCFEEHIMMGLEEKLKLVKPGTKILTVTKNLESPEFRYIKQREYNMNWGKSTVHFQERA